MRIISAATVICPRAADSSRRIRSWSAVVASIWAGAVTTGMQLIISTGSLMSRVCARLPRGMQICVGSVRAGRAGKFHSGLGVQQGDDAQQ